MSTPQPIKVFFVDVSRLGIRPIEWMEGVDKALTYKEAETAAKFHARPDPDFPKSSAPQLWRIREVEYVPREWTEQGGAVTNNLISKLEPIIARMRLGITSFRDIERFVDLAPALFTRFEATERIVLASRHSRALYRSGHHPDGTLIRADERIVADKDLDDALAALKGPNE